MIGLRVEKNRSKKAKCRICGNRIVEEYRLYDAGSHDIFYYHIDCVIKTGDALRHESYKNILDVNRRGVDVTQL